MIVSQDARTESKGERELMPREETGRDETKDDHGHPGDKQLN